MTWPASSPATPFTSSTPAGPSSRRTKPDPVTRRIRLFSPSSRQTCSSCAAWAYACPPFGSRPTLAQRFSNDVVPPLSSSITGWPIGENDAPSRGCGSGLRSELRAGLFWSSRVKPGASCESTDGLRQSAGQLGRADRKRVLHQNDTLPGPGGLTGMEQRKSPLVEPALPEAPGTERRIFASPDRSVLSRQSGVLQRRVGTHLA